MTEPTTAAGRALLATMERRFDIVGDTWTQDILAIEAEARQQDSSALQARLQEVVDQLDDYGPSGPGFSSAINAARAVLAALPPRVPACPECGVRPPLHKVSCPTPITTRTLALDDVTAELVGVEATLDATMRRLKRATDDLARLQVDRPRDFGQQWDKAGPDDPANRLMVDR